MTSQQLRTYIGRVLGKSLRLVLPSLWWRKLFEAVADRVDEVEGLIATSFKEYEKEHPSISSRTLYWTEDPESEEAKHNVGLISKTFIGLLMAAESERKLEQILYLAIPSISVEAPYLYEIVSPAWTLSSSGDIAFVFLDVNLPGVTNKVNITFSGETGIVTVEEIESSSITVDSAMSSTSTNPVQNKVVKVYVDDTVAKSIPPTSINITDSITEYLKSPFVGNAIITKISSSEGAYYFMDTIGETSVNGVGYIFVEYDTPAGRYRRLYNPSTGAFVSEELVSSTDIEIEVDSELSDTSTNAVQNKAIKLYVDTALSKKVDKVTGKQLSTEDFTSALKTKLEGLNNYDDTEINNALSKLQTQLDTLVSGDASTAIESFNEIIAFLSGITDSEGLDAIIASIEQQIANKVDKVEGKGLSTEDYTTKDKTKLEGIEEGAQKNVQSDWDEDDETSSAFIKNKPVIEVDTSMSGTSEKAVQNKVIKSYIDGEVEVLTEAILDNEEVISKGLNSLNRKIIQAINERKINYATKSELSSGLEALNKEDLDNEEVTSIALNYLNQRINKLKNDLLINYVKGITLRAEVEAIMSIIGSQEQAILTNEQVISSSLNDLNERIEFTQNRFINYATKSELSSEISRVEQAILTNEQVISSSLNDLNERIEQLTSLVKSTSVTA